MNPERHLRRPNGIRGAPPEPHDVVEADGYGGTTHPLRAAVWRSLVLALVILVYAAPSAAQTTYYLNWSSAHASQGTLTSSAPPYQWGYVTNYVSASLGAGQKQTAQFAIDVYSDAPQNVTATATIRGSGGTPKASCSVHSTVSDYDGIGGSCAFGAYSEATGDYLHVAFVWDDTEYWGIIRNYSRVTLTGANTPGVPGSISGPFSSYTGAYTLYWGAASGAVTRYELHEDNVLAYSGSALSMNFSGRSGGVHRYKVRACGAGGCSAFTPEHVVTVTYVPGATGPISGPTSSATGSYALQCGAASGAVAHYELYENGVVAEASGTCSFLINGRPDGFYRYTARACNVAGCGPYTPEHLVSVALPGPPPAAEGIVLVGAGPFSHWGPVGIPNGTIAGDLMVAVCQYASSAPSGWTRKAGPLFYRRASSSSETPPTFPSASNCQIATFRGATSSGDPFEAIGSVAVVNGEDASGTVTLPLAPGLTTTTPGAWVLMVVTAWAEDWDGGAAGTSFPRPSGLERTVFANEAGGIALHSGERPVPGAFPSQPSGTVFIQDLGEYWATTMLVSLKPYVPAQPSRIYPSSAPSDVAGASRLDLSLSGSTVETAGTKSFVTDPLIAAVTLSGSVNFSLPVGCGTQWGCDYSISLARIPATGGAMPFCSTVRSWDPEPELGILTGACLIGYGYPGTGSAIALNPGDRVKVTIQATTPPQDAYLAYWHNSPDAWIKFGQNLPLPTLKAVLPVFSPAAGSFVSVQAVAISSVTAGASIYYTTDGTTPTTSSSLYTGPVTVSSTTTLKAIAAATGYSASAVASATYTINLPAAATPAYSPPAGAYPSPQSVSIASATPGASIYFTTDGTTPTTSSTPYTSPLSVDRTTTIRAVAFAPGFGLSAIGTAAYGILLPDLRLSGVAGPSEATPGRPFSIQYTVENVGGAVAAPFAVCFYLSATEGVDPSSIPLGQTTEPELTGGASRTNTLETTLPQVLDGTYHLVAFADCDAALPEESEANNQSDGGLVTVVTDALPPVVTLVAPTPGAIVGVESLVVSVRVTDDAGVSSVVAGSAVLADQGDGTWSGTVALVEGPNLIDVVAEDLGGHFTWASVLVYRDTTPPSFVLASPLDGTVTQEQDVILSGQVVDASAVSLTVNGQSIPVGAAGAFHWPFALALGSNSVTLAATDGAGNVGTRTSTLFRAFTPITLVMSEPRSAFSTTAPLVTVAGSVSGGAAPYVLRINGMPTEVMGDGTFVTGADMAFGENFVSAHVTDAAGATASKTVSGWRSDGANAGGWCTPNPGTELLYDAVGNLTAVVNTATDPENCGCVGHSCTGGSAACRAGICGAEGPNGFVDTMTDPFNCGQLNHVCRSISGGFTACTNGMCAVTCPAGQVAAGGQCADLTTSVEHCGFRFTRCPGATEGIATCTNGLCGTQGVPSVTALNGAMQPGVLPGITQYAPLTVSGANLEKVHRVEVEDWGDDAGAPVFTGLDWGEWPFDARPDLLTVPVQGPGWGPDFHRWFKLRLYYMDMGMEASVLVDVAASVDPDEPYLAAADPVVATVGRVRSLPIGYSASETTLYSPATGFLRTVVDLTKLSEPPTAVLSVDGASEFAIYSVTSRGVHLRAGLDPTRVTTEYYSGGEWILRGAAFVFSGGPVHFDWPHHAQVILRGTDLACDGTVVPMDTSGAPVGDGNPWVCGRGRALVNVFTTHYGPGSLEYRPAIGAPAQSTELLDFINLPRIDTLDGVDVSAGVWNADPVDVRVGYTYRISGRGLADVWNAHLDGNSIHYRVIDDHNIDVKIRHCRYPWDEDDHSSVQLGLVSSHCPLLLMESGPYWQCAASNRRVRLVGLPVCAAPPPGLPPNPPDPPSGGIALLPPLSPTSSGGDCTNNVCP